MELTVKVGTRPDLEDFAARNASAAAERSGMHRGMVIVEVGKRPIRGRDDLAAVLAESKSGTVLVMRVAFPGRGKAVMGVELP